MFNFSLGFLIITLFKFLFLLYSYFNNVYKNQIKKK